jgi:hypothetical protein
MRKIYRRAFVVALALAAFAAAARKQRRPGHSVVRIRL